MRETVAHNLFFPEAPRWHKGEQKLYFSDILDKKICRVDLSGCIETILTTTDLVSGIGWLPNGDFLFVLMNERYIRRIPQKLVSRGNVKMEETNLHTHLDTPQISIANDMIVLANGISFCGCFRPGMKESETIGPKNPPREAYIMKINASGESSVAIDRTCFPNGMCLSLDGRSLIVAETFAHVLTQWDINENGDLVNRRPFAYMGVPTDGICLDAEGCVWVACPYFSYGDSGGYVRVAECGEVKQVIEIKDPTKSAYACQLGGEDGRTLFLCESKVYGKDRSMGDGQIRATKVDVPSALYS